MWSKQNKYGWGCFRILDSENYGKRTKEMLRRTKGNVAQNRKRIRTNANLRTILHETKTNPYKHELSIVDSASLFASRFLAIPGKYKQTRLPINTVNINALAKIIFRLFKYQVWGLLVAGIA